MSLRASVAYIAVRAISGVLSVGALSLFVRGLGPEQYAHFALGLAAAALASTVVMMPLNTTLARLYADVEARQSVLATLLDLVLALGLVLCVVALLVERVGASWLAPWILPAAALLAAAQGVLDFSAQHANSALESRRYARLLLVRSVGVVVFGAVAMSFSAYAPAILLAMALACAVSVAVSMRKRLFWREFDGFLAPRIASFALPLVVTCALSYTLQWGDRYLLMRYVPMIELGRYSALADLTQQTLVLVCSGLGAAWYPRIVQAWGRGQRNEAQRLLSRYALIGILIVLPAAVGFSVLLAPTASLLFGQAYADLPSALPMLLVFAAVIGACKSFYFDVPMLLAERMWRLAGGIALSAFASLAIMAWAVPWYGISGAALGLICGQSLGLVYSFFMGRDVLQHAVGVRQLCSVIAACVLMGTVLLSWQPGGIVGLLLRIAAGVFTYGLTLLALDFDEARARLAAMLKKLQ